MRKRTMLLLLFGLILKSCCHDSSIETARYELSIGELELIPYQKGEKVNFIHSNGHTFDFEVVEDNLEWDREYDFCEWNCCGNDYYSYQSKITTLESTYPKLRIELKLGEDQKIYGYESNGFSIGMNNDYTAHFAYNSATEIICDSITKTLYYDTLQINSKAYYDVYENPLETFISNPDSILFVPKSVFYNKSLGIIQIKMSNDETYSINN